MKSKSAVSNSSAPAHVLLSPTDNNKVLDFINFNTVGSNNVNGSTAFKKIQSASKSSSQTLFSFDSDYSLKYNKLNNLYLADSNSQDSLYYGIKRQHEYATSMACLNGTPSLLDNKSTQRMLDYNFDLTTSPYTYSNSSNNTFMGDTSDTSSSALISNSLSSNVGLVQDTNGEFGSAKVTRNNNLINASLINSFTPSDLCQSNDALSTLNKGLNYSQFFVKSPNQQILSSDRNIRNIDYISPNKVNYNMSNVSSLMNQLSTRFTLSHIPTTANNSNTTSISYDRFNDKNMNGAIMSAKEELAPNFLFTPFWVSV